MADSSSLDALVEALRRLPGVGVKSASRMAFHLLQHDREGAQLLARALQQAATQRAALRALQHLHRSDGLQHLPRRRAATRRKLCVVETPADQAALERTGSFRGYYFVLMGKLSPLDGIGPKDIGAARAVRARRRRHGRGGDPRHQLHRRGRGHGARASARRSSSAACT